MIAIKQMLQGQNSKIVIRDDFNNYLKEKAAISSHNNILIHNIYTKLNNLINKLYINFNMKINAFDLQVRYQYAINKLLKQLDK